MMGGDRVIVHVAIVSCIASAFSQAMNPQAMNWLGQPMRNQGSTLAVVRSSETTIKCYGRVLKITNSSGGRVSFKEQIFL